MFKQDFKNRFAGLAFLTKNLFHQFLEMKFLHLLHQKILYLLSGA